MELKQKLEDEVPVAVIGGGIVGPVMAYILGERGVRVHLYEARHKGINGSRGRAINLSLSRRGIDALVRMGVSDEVLKETAPYYGRCIHLPNSGGKTKLQFYIGNEKKEAIHSINRRRLSELVLKRLEENPNVKVFYGYQLINIEHKNKILHFNVKREGEEESNNKKSIKAKFIIGCDGFNSSVRKSILGSISYYQQNILDEVYHELYLPQTQNGESAIQYSDMFHIWQLGEVMMVGLPNKGNSFNIILYTPLSLSRNIKTPSDVLEFFRKNFPDVQKKIPKDQLIDDFFRKTPSKLNIMKCYPYHYGNILLLGDAAHCVHPFCGQGVNAALEDCLIFEECLEEKDGDLPTAAELFTNRRWKDLHTLADQSLNNFTTSRKGANSNWLWIKLESLLSTFLPNVFKQIYPMVVFTRGRYSELYEREKWQKKLVNITGIIIIIIIGVAVVVIISYFINY